MILWERHAARHGRGNASDVHSMETYHPAEAENDETEDDEGRQLGPINLPP